MPPGDIDKRQELALGPMAPHALACPPPPPPSRMYSFAAHQVTRGPEGSSFLALGPYERAFLERYPRDPSDRHAQPMGGEA